MLTSFNAPAGWYISEVPNFSLWVDSACSFGFG